ncbi:MAG: hypothetical protein KBT11_03815 [Treponema sp.]|nr:hypothetical protein [Candidatus Treponema equifaecale]
MASDTVNKNESKFDKLPIAVQMIVGIGALLGIAAAGFGVFVLFDLLLLDFDPIAKLAGAIASLF